MVIDEFARYLRKSDPNLSALVVLARWLWENLTFENNHSNVNKILKTEIRVSISRKNNTNFKNKNNIAVPVYLFTPRSKSGKNLLERLYEFCLSYEHQRWARFIHHIKASDFN